MQSLSVPKLDDRTRVLKTAPKTGAPLVDYATHGCGFPILLLVGGTCIGAITISGLPQREDHELIVAVLAEHLGQPLAELALG